MAPYIFSIQKYAIHDGSGIRTAVFFKGCPLSCTWCHNPESQSFYPELMHNTEKCHSCGICADACSSKAVRFDREIINFNNPKCQACGSCAMVCPYNAIDICGKEYSLSALISLLMKDRMFYEISGGGVTLTGGEVMASDMDYVEDLLKHLHISGINTAIDTCGYAPYKNFQRLLPYTDTFLYDVKHMDSATHIEYTGVDNTLIIENLIALRRDGANIHVRIPVIHGFNADWESMKRIIEFVNEINPQNVSFLPYHNIAKGKYAMLGRPYQDRFEPPSEDFLKELKGLQGMYTSKYIYRR